MKAAVYHGPHDVRIEQVPDPGDRPRLGPSDVLLEVLAASLCGTDAGEYAHGPVMVPLHRRHPGSGHLGPTILGHEFVGRILAVGSGVEGMSVGDRVVPGAGMWCGECAWCEAGRTNLCSRYFTLGLNADGGLTERFVVPARMCRPVPEGVEDHVAAMAQPFAVALHAVRRGRVEQGEVVVLIGVGGIGTFALPALVARGARVIALDVDPGALESAKRLGAEHALDARAEDLQEQLQALLGEGVPVDAVVETSGAPPAPELARRLVRRGGRIVLVGMQAKPRELDLTDMVLREVELVTSVAHVCGDDLPEALALLSDPQQTLAQEALGPRIPLDAVVDEGLEPLVNGTAGGKVVVEVFANA
jgi:(R,R)-butanediol dehydrogenase / meso-butanediol dehydrogenase / diacetyl reductase